jgi:hypothetical protein
MWGSEQTRDTCSHNVSNRGINETNQGGTTKLETVYTESTVKSQAPLSNHPGSALRWWAFFVAGIVLLVASLTAGAVGRYVLDWF